MFFFWVRKVVLSLLFFFTELFFILRYFELKYNNILLDILFY